MRRLFTLSQPFLEHHEHEKTSKHQASDMNSAVTGAATVRFLLARHPSLHGAACKLCHKSQACRDNRIALLSGTAT